MKDEQEELDAAEKSLPQKGEVHKHEPGHTSSISREAGDLGDEGTAAGSWLDKEQPPPSGPPV